MTDVFGGVWGSVDDCHASGHDAEENGHSDARDGGDEQLLLHERPFVEQDVKDVHGKVSFSKAMVQTFGALEQTKVDGAARLVTVVPTGCGHHPVVCSKATWN